MATNTNLDAFKEVQETTTIDTSKKFRIGVIGCGWIAGSHMKALKAQPYKIRMRSKDLPRKQARRSMRQQS